MAEKVYEPDEDYKELAENLVKMLETRAELARTVKLAAPEHLAEGQRLLAEMDRSIEQFEATLAESYKAYQEFLRKDEDLGKMNDLIGNRLEMMFIYTKHVLPEKFELLEMKLLNTMPPEDAEEFLDRVAVRETNELEKIIAEMTGNKEWRKALENLS